MSGKIFGQYIYFMEKKNLYVLYNAIFAKKKKKKIRRKMKNIHSSGLTLLISGSWAYR